MSQDHKKPKRRDSILKTRQIVEGEVEEERGPAGFKRRVSFRNVKEIQFYDTDTKNCADLLHDAEPLKEKINETLGSDGVITPGRSSTLHSHSSKNNTIDMFGDKAQKPIPMVQEMHVETLIIEDDRDHRVMNATTHTVVDMDISEIPAAKVEELDASNLNPDDTMNVFRPYRPGRQVTSVDANSTMAVFMERSQDGEELPLNDTMDVFKVPATKEQTGGEELMDDTMNLFRSPASRKMKTSKLPQQKKAADEKEEEEAVLNSTMDLFRGSTARPNTTIRGEVDMEMSGVGGALASRTMIGDVSMDITQANETLANDTMDLFRPAPPQAAVDEAAERPLKEKKAYDPNSTMAVFQTPEASQELPSPAPSKAATAAPIADEALNATMDVFCMPKVKEVTEPERSYNFTPVTEKSGGATPPVDEPMEEASPKECPMETQRKMHLSMCVDEPLDASPKDPLMENKISPTTEGPASAMDTSAVSNVTTASFGGGDTTLRASILSQSRRSRRRSSLGTTMRESMIQSPHSLLQASLLQDPNQSIQEQLSFHFRNTLFDSSVVNVKKETLAKLEPVVDENLKRSKALLEELLPQVAAKHPEKASAIENLNCRRLGAFDRDAFSAALTGAEAIWFEERRRLAAGQAKAVREKKQRMAAQIDVAERDALLCEGLEKLEAETAELEKKALELEQLDCDAAKKLDEEEARLLEELAEMDIQEQIQKRERLEKEMAFVRQHAKNTHAALDAHAKLISDISASMDSLHSATFKD